MRISTQARDNVCSILGGVPHRTGKALHQRRKSVGSKLLSGLMVPPSVPVRHRLILPPWPSKHTAQTPALEGIEHV
eukprot:795174-Pyramimonas_sp.AAC.1